MKAFNNKKHHFLILITTIFLILTTMFQPITAYAVDANAIVNTIVNSLSTNGGGGGQSGYVNGVSATRTGYIVYMVNKQSGARTSEVLQYLCGSLYSGTVDITNGRRGGGTGSYAGTPPWGYTPWEYLGDGQVASNEPQIKQWFVEHGHEFVKQRFPANLSKFEIDEEVVVVETLMNFQFQDCLGKTTGGLSYDQAKTIALQRMKSAGIDGAYIRSKIASEAAPASVINNIYTSILSKLTFNIMNNPQADGSNQHYDSPYLGTVSNLIDKRASLPASASFADNYLKAVAPRSEYIKKSEAGFTNWTGGYPMSFSDVQNYGVAMMIIHCMDSSQTTCDEPLIPNPHNPPDESDGTKRIIKNYRTRNLTTNELTENGNTFTIEQVSADILIEDEDEYVVVGWATSSGTSFIPSPTWESSITSTGTLTQKGLSSGSVKLADPNEKTLYVLLEKPESEEVEELDYNYLMTQSMITRTVWQNYPDEEGAGWEYLYDYDFTWESKGHLKKCAGHSCVHDLNDNCESDDTDGDGTDDKFWCGGHNDTHPCTFNKYSDSDIRFSLYNYLKDDYPDILATKEGTFRGIEVPFGEVDMLLKRWEPFYSWNLTDRPDDKMYTTDTYETSAEKDWEYISVLMRGKDKLTVAQWANAGEAFYEATSANEDLEEASESGFKVDNVKTGTRKSDVYYEAFDELFNTEGDVYTEVEPKDSASEGYCDHCSNKWHCTEGHNYILSTTMQVHVVVKIETYSGNSSGGYADNSLDDSEIIVFGNSISDGYFSSGSQNTHSGRQVKSGGSISFLPYVLMKYQTLASGTQGYYDTLEHSTEGEGWLKAYVLGQYYRSIIPNDYAEINWTRKSDENLTLTSTQWSTHALATDAWGTNNVLPGGATLGLKIKENDRQKIYLTTYQCYVDGKGKNQCEITGGTTGEDSGMSLADAQGNHSAFVYEFADALDNTNVQQWQNKNPHKDVAWDGGQKVNRNGSNTDSSTWDISGLDVSGTKTSSDSKYYFGDHYEGSGKGDYDVDVKETKLRTYTFTSDVNGNIHMYVDNINPSDGDEDAGAYSATAEIINARTGVRDKLIAAVEQAVNGDYTLGDNKQICSDEKALNGEKWYNEAFDGITVVVQETEIISGFVDPFERTEILDPKLTKVQSSKSGQMGMNLDEDDTAGRQATYELGQFKTREYSESYRIYQVMSSFKNKYVQMKDLEYLYWSRKFWIPNFTVQDIY